MLITKSLNSTRITSSDISLPAGRCPLRKVPGPFREASNSIRMARWSRIIITIIIMDIRGTNMGMGDMMGTSMGTSMTDMDMGLMRTNMGTAVWVWVWGIIIMGMGDMRAGDMDMDMDIIMGMGMEVSMDGMG